MPQMDKLTYLSQNLWIFLVSFNFYLFLILILFTGFVNIKKSKVFNIDTVIFFIFSLTLTIYLSIFPKKI